MHDETGCDGEKKKFAPFEKGFLKKVQINYICRRKTELVVLPRDREGTCSRPRVLAALAGRGREADRRVFHFCRPEDLTAVVTDSA